MTVANHLYVHRPEKAARIGRAFAVGKVLPAYRVLRENQLTYDGQDFFDNAHQHPDKYRERIAELVEEVEPEAGAEREARGVEPLGVEAILRQDRHTRPNQTRRSPAPAYHAATKAARERFWEAYSAFVVAFREAADKLKSGDQTARFPVGSFPPAPPFVSAYPSLPP